MLTEEEYIALNKKLDEITVRMQQLNTAAYVMAMRLLQSEFYLEDEEIRTEVDYVLHLNK
jgi:hypothetical protein